MRITTWNVNGLRAAIRKGFGDCIDRIQPDVLLLQEIRVVPDQLPPDWRQPAGWHVVWHPAEKRGYSGTAIWSREPLEHVQTGLSAVDADHEGRVISARVCGINLASVYLPSGSSGQDRQNVKDQWLGRFRRWTAPRRDAGPFVFGGDLNIAHTERDIFHAKSNEKTSGFLPHERDWFGRLLKSGWHDLVREHAGDQDGPYSWWSNRGRARELDRGWRIDYLLANAAARESFQAADTDREAGLLVSDHAPVSIDLNI